MQAAKFLHIDSSMNSALAIIFGLRLALHVLERQAFQLNAGSLQPYEISLFLLKTHFRSANISCLCDTAQNVGRRVSFI